MTRCTALLTAGALSLAAALLPAGTAVADPSPGVRAADRALAAQVLPTGDGWASLGEGTSGGASDRRPVVVDDLGELARAVAGDTPKVVLVRGRIDANTDDRGRQLSCADYARDGYSLESYLQTYDPAVWGRDTVPEGPVEDARAASANAQAAQITVRIGSHTTLLGLPGAAIRGAYLRVDGESDVIVRGLTLTDAADCFPAWDPTDDASGNWNSAYDLLSLTGADHVWVDGNAFSDRPDLDARQPVYFGRPYQVHDGALDITNGSDLVTVSRNRFTDHDKTMLIGSSDSRLTDRGHLRVTIHTNLFRDVGQRVPRVRFGQVDVYNNSYVETRRDDDYEYVYSLGVGKESHIVADRNAFTLARGIDVGTVVGRYGGTSLTERGNRVNGRPVDLVAAANATGDPDLTEVPPWAPLLRRSVRSAAAVPALVAAQAGPDQLRGRR